MLATIKADLTQVHVRPSANIDSTGSAEESIAPLKRPSSRRSRVHRDTGRLGWKGRCGVKLTPTGTSAHRKLRVEYFSNCPDSVDVEITYFRQDGTELVGSSRIGPHCQIDLKPYLGPPGDVMDKRIVEHCQTRFSGQSLLAIHSGLRKKATRVSLAFSALDQDSCPIEGNVFRLERRKSKLGLGDSPKPNYGFPLSVDEAQERMEWLALHFGLLGDEEWRAIALDRVTNLVYGGVDNPLVVSRLSRHNEEVNRVMGGIIKFAKIEARSAMQWESLAEEPMAAPAPASAIDPERHAWQLEIVESMLEDCTPDLHVSEFVLRALKLEDGTSQKKLSDEFDIHYPTSRSYVHRAKKYLGLV